MTSASCSSTTASPPSPASPAPNWWTWRRTPRRWPAYRAGILAAFWAVHGDEPASHPVATELSAHIAERLAWDDFDLTVFSRQPAGRTLGHAFTFPRYRLGLPATRADRAGVRQHLLPAERAVRRALLRPGPGAAPGGRVLAVRRAGRRHRLRRADPLRHRRGAGPPGSRLDRRRRRRGPRRDLHGTGSARATRRSSTGSPPPGHSRASPPTVLDYVPGYRTPAGTGTGMAFARWD